ncbi:MAG: nitroreductase family protein [Actinoplanes sp.]
MENPAQILHRLTSYEPGREWDDVIDDPRLVLDLVPNDLDRLPWFYKRYPEPVSRVPLPAELPSTTAPAVDVLAGVAKAGRQAVDLPQLSRLLHLSAGIVRTSQRKYGPHPFRAAGSAGGRFPLELYVLAPDGGDLPPGVHWYDPAGHALVLLGPPPSGSAPAVVVTGVPWRTGWRYRERGFRHIYWDAGTMLAQLLAAADSAGLPASLYSRFPDRTVTELIGADGVHEWPVAVVALGEGAPALTPTGPARHGEVDRAPLEFPLVTAAQRAGDATVLGEPWPRGLPVPLPAEPAPSAGEPALVPSPGESAPPSASVAGESAPVEAVVLSRGSQRRMDPAGTLPAHVLTTGLRVAVRGIDLPHFVAVHQVDGVEPGVYRWPDLTSPRHAGDQRAELYRVSLDQSLSRDAAFVVITAADVSALDARRYREAQLAAGLVEGRLHLLAYALGASASGMTFLDSEMPALFAEPLDAMLFTCVGVPEYTSTAGGRPGAPTSVRLITPRP